MRLSTSLKEPMATAPSKPPARPRIGMLKGSLVQADLSCAQPDAGSLDFADPRRGSAASRGYGREWHLLRKAVMKRDGYRCRCHDCRAAGRLLPAEEVDHIIPKSQGGTDAMNNLQAISKACHQLKTQREARGGVQLLLRGSAPRP